jgi:hypothetical protein
LQPIGKRYQRKAEETSLAKTAVADLHVLALRVSLPPKSMQQQGTSMEERWGRGYKLYVASKADGSKI